MVGGNEQNSSFMNDSQDAKVVLPLADRNVFFFFFRISATTLVHLVGSPLPMSGSTNNKSTTDGWMDEVTLQA